jgi:Endonuclease/Exonuclease/phosphatase family
MEEVDRFAFSDILAELTPLKYGGIFQPKGNNGQDGLALFFRTDRFAIVNQRVVQYRQASQVAMFVQLRLISDPEQSSVAATTTTAAAAAADGVAVVGEVLLDDDGDMPALDPDSKSSLGPSLSARSAQPVGREADVYLVFTHLKAKPPFTKVRTSQVSQLLQELDVFMLETIAAEDAQDDRQVREAERLRTAAPIIVCGDLNDTPDSKPVKLLKDKFASAYSQFFSDSDGFLPYTTYKKRKGTITQRTIDYIFHSISRLSVERVLSVPDAQVTFPNQLPCAQYPSDHLSIAAEFTLRPM